jgi:hypothetical protein
MNKVWRFLALAVVVLLVFPRGFRSDSDPQIRYDPPGADYTSNKQLCAEYIVINTGSRARQLCLGDMWNSNW